MAKATERERPDYTVYIIGVILLPVFFLFLNLGQRDMGLFVYIGLLANMLAIRVRWDLRKHTWFWAVIALVLAFHVPLFFIVPWPQGRIPRVGLLPIAVAEYLIVLGAVRCVEKFIVKPPPPKEEGIRS